MGRWQYKDDGDDDVREIDNNPKWMKGKLFCDTSQEKGINKFSLLVSLSIRDYFRRIFACLGIFIWLFQRISFVYGHDNSHFNTRFMLIGKNFFRLFFKTNF